MWNLRNTSGSLGLSLWLAVAPGCVRADRIHASRPSAAAHGDSRGAATHDVRIDAPALYPETLVWSQRHDAFLVGSVRQGGVFRVDGAGSARPLVDDPRLSSVLGIAVDEGRNRLWVTNSDLGVATRPSAAGAKNVAAVGLYELSSGRALAYVDLAPLSEGPHLVNGIALDEAGNAYVTDSFSPVIYAVSPDGTARVFARDARFAGAGINLNGVVVHERGYLLVIKKSDGALFKVPLAQPEHVTRVATDASLRAGDGLLLAGEKQLVVIANRIAGAEVDAALVLTSDDDWETAKLAAQAPIGAVYPTTAARRGDGIYLLHTKLDALLMSTPAERDALQERATIEDIGSIDAAGVRLAGGTGPQASATVVSAAGVRRTLIAQRVLPDRPDWESRLYLIDFPPGTTAPLHDHPVQCVGYVLEGTFESAFGLEALTVKHAGESFVDEVDRPHRFRNPDPDRRLRFLVAGTFPKEAPLFRPVPR